MFSPTLKEKGRARLVYATSAWFRLAFALLAVVVVLSVLSVPEGTLVSRLNAVSIVILCLCLFAVLYLERWTFDKEANAFERQIGVLFLYARRKRPLDALTKVVLRETGSEGTGRPAFLGLGPRRMAVLSVVDRDGKAYTMEMARGASVRALKESAERLSAFCGIPLEVDAGGRAVPDREGRDEPPELP